MKFTNEQKLIAMMVAEVHQKLGITNGVDSSLVLEALISGNEWAIEFEYSGSFLEQAEPPPHVKHVIDAMDMWSFIEDAYATLDDNEKERFANDAYPYGEPRFEGFDGNDESEYLSAARILVNNLHRFRCFSGRDLNSHGPSIHRDSRMLAAFKPIRATLGLGSKRQLDVDDLITIFKI